MSVIEVQDLTKDYGHGRGVFDVSFRVEKGEVFGFLGPNGAGKSTTIRHLLGFSKPQSGSTKIFGEETFDRYHAILNRVGYIPGEIAIPQGLTGWEFIRLMQDLQKCRNEENLRSLLELFRLDPTGETKRMSLGVKRKLAIVVAFMHDPEVLILDEPTSGLDPMMQDVFVQYIKREKERGKTILLSSHIFSEVDATCEKIAIIKDGRVVSEFVADDLRHATDKDYRVRFATKEAFDAFSAGRYDFCTVKNLSPAENAVVFSVNDKDVNEVVRLLSAFPVTEFRHLKVSLQDYFMQYYKEDKSFTGVFRQ